MSEQNGTGKPRGKSRKWPITVAVVAVVAAVAGGGFWSRQSSFSFATPSSYAHGSMPAAFEQSRACRALTTSGEYGEHRFHVGRGRYAAAKEEGGAGMRTGLSCHKTHHVAAADRGKRAGHWQHAAVRQRNLWIGAWERDTEQLGEWLRQDGDAFCFEPACHNITRQGSRRRRRSTASATRIWPCMGSSLTAEIAIRRIVRR